MDTRNRTPDLTLSFTVDKSPAEVYDAVNNVPAWWIGEVTGGFDRVGAVFTYAYKTFHRTVQEVTALVPGRLVEWRVTESRINFVEDKEEWKGTTIRFEIREAGDATELRFTHVGLTPAIACYESCSAGWVFYVETGLRSLIETGRGVAPPF